MRNDPCPPLMSPPTSVKLVYTTPDGDIEVTIDPTTVGAVVWDANAARAISRVQCNPGHNPPGVQAHRKLAGSLTSADTSTMTTTSLSVDPGDVAPPSCYWVGGQLVCC